MKDKNVGMAAMLKPLGIGLLSATIISAVLLFLFAALLSMQDFSPVVTAVFSMIALGIASFFGGMISAKLFGKSGMLIGFALGILLFLIVTLVSMALSSAGFTIITLVKLILAPFAGMVGGIFGVNFKRKRKFI